MLRAAFEDSGLREREVLVVKGRKSLDTNEGIIVARLLEEPMRMLNICCK